MTVYAKGYRLKLPAFAPVAVIDIGSNSVRLVVYDALRRAASPVFNEKVLCGLGRGIASTGNLNAAGVERALRALARFAALNRQIGTVRVFAIATAAAREATNGPDFIAAAGELLSTEVRVLTGKQEARFAAEGVMSGIPGADGIAGDLGGGSLELIDIRDGNIRGGVTLPLGPLRLLDIGKDDEAGAEAVIERALDDKAGLLAALAGRSFYAVGGAWRNIAKMHMAEVDHPLSVLQQYTLGRQEAGELVSRVARLTPTELKNIDEVSARRVDTGKVYTAVFPFEVGFTGVGLWPWIIAALAFLQLNFWYMSRRRKAVAAASIAILCGLLASPEAGAADETWTSDAGHFVVSFEAELQPLEINRIHSWVVHIETAAGADVINAEIDVEGGMPEHNHGLPTRPRVAGNLGGGNYRIAGIRFHMSGYWELRFFIDDGSHRDKVTIPLQLP